MSQQIWVQLEMPDDLEVFRFPESLDQRLQALLDKQDGGAALSPEERVDAEGLVEMAEMLTLLRPRAEIAVPRRMQLP
jgi:hypothetical protein